MKPDLEVVQIGQAESFKAWEHGYPFRTVRWHFHPEYELHHVVSTSGRYFVGDFIGVVRAGQPGADRAEPAAQLGQRHGARRAGARCAAGWCSSPRPSSPTPWR